MTVRHPLIGARGRVVGIDQAVLAHSAVRGGARASELAVSIDGAQLTLTANLRLCYRGGLPIGSPSELSASQQRSSDRDQGAPVRILGLVDPLARVR